MCLLCCSTAGLRSGKYAEGLLKEGFTDVRNLEGSILAWVMTLFWTYDDCLVDSRTCTGCTEVNVPQAGAVHMQTQEGYALVKQDQSPTTDVHVFSKDWALQGDKYHGVYFSKGG